MERWKPIKGLEDRYEVSDHGKIRSIPRIALRSNGVTQTVRGKIIAQRNSGIYGHKMISLNTPEGRIHRSVHRLVAEEFCEKPEGCNVVNHLDSDPTNNHWSNLEWTTPSGNHLHMREKGRGKVPRLKGEEVYTSKYTESQALKVIEELKTGEKHRVIADKLGVSKCFVDEISRGKGWKHLPR